MDELPDGWAFPGNSRKAHYFVGFRSLCEKWVLRGQREPDNGKAGPDDCASCRKRLDKREAASVRQEG